MKNLEKTNWLKEIENTKTVFNFMLRDIDETYMVDYFIDLYKNQKPNGNFWADLCKIGSSFDEFENLIDFTKIEHEILFGKKINRFIDQENDDWADYLVHETEYHSGLYNISDHKNQKNEN